VEPAEQFAAARELRARLKYAFDKEGIEFPFPQRTVWMHQVDAQAKEPRQPVTGPDELDLSPAGAEEAESE